MVRPGGVTTPVGSTLWADREVVVDDKDVESVVLALQEGFTVAGAVANGGDASRDGTRSRNPVIAVERTDGYDIGPIPVTPLGRDGTFRTVPLPPGPYVLELMSPGAGSGPDKASRPSRVFVTVGSQGVEGVTLVSDETAGALKGKVVLASGAACGRCSVYVFSESKHWWEGYGSRSSRVREAITDEDGVYELDALPAGDYYAHAVSKPDPTWRLSSSLAALVPVSTRVRVIAKSTTAIELKARDR